METHMKASKAETFFLTAAALIALAFGALTLWDAITVNMLHGLLHALGGAACWFGGRLLFVTWASRARAPREQADHANATNEDRGPSVPVCLGIRKPVFHGDYDFGVIAVDSPAPADRLRAGEAKQRFGEQIADQVMAAGEQWAEHELPPAGTPLQVNKIMGSNLTHPYTAELVGLGTVELERAENEAKNASLSAIVAAMPTANPSDFKVKPLDSALADGRALHERLAAARPGEPIEMPKGWEPPEHPDFCACADCLMTVAACGDRAAYVAYRDAAERKRIRDRIPSPENMELADRDQAFPNVLAMMGGGSEDAGKLNFIAQMAAKEQAARTPKLYTYRFNAPISVQEGDEVSMDLDASGIVNVTLKLADGTALAIDGVPAVAEMRSVVTNPDGLQLTSYTYPPVRISSEYLDHLTDPNSEKAIRQLIPDEPKPRSIIGATILKADGTPTGEVVQDYRAKEKARELEQRVGKVFFESIRFTEPVTILPGDKVEVMNGRSWLVRDGQPIDLPGAEAHQLDANVAAIVESIDMRLADMFVSAEMSEDDERQIQPLVSDLLDLHRVLGRAPTVVAGFPVEWAYRRDDQDAAPIEVPDLVHYREWLVEGGWWRSLLVEHGSVAAVADHLDNWIEGHDEFKAPYGATARELQGGVITEGGIIDYQDFANRRDKESNGDPK